MMLTELIEKIAKSLVDKPDAVSVTEVASNQSTIVELRVATEDLGKIIGKEGRTARALRMLTQALAAKEHRQAVLVIIE